MTVKEQAHQLVDRLPEHATWEDLLDRLERAARRLRELPGSRAANAAETTQRGAAPSSRERELRQFLEREIWPQIPADVLGKPLTKEEREAILGYGSAGV